VTRPRIADDFAAIHARMEQLQRERAEALTSGQDEREKLASIFASRGEELRKPRTIPILPRQPRI
jgi:hypothetical protein